jgi:uncharacterized protein YecE (DUF72 family)
MKPIDRNPRPAKAKAIRASVLPPLYAQGIHLGLSSRVLKFGQKNKVSPSTDLFSALEVNMDMYSPPQESTLLSLLQGSYQQIIWHAEISELEDLKTLRPEFALFLTQLIELQAETTKEQLFILSLQPTATYSDQWLDQLQQQRDNLPYTFLIESTHRSWKTERVQTKLKSAGIEQVSLDAPKLFGLIKDVDDLTAKRSYLRLLGRNSREWFEAPPKKYEYQYPLAEIHEIVERIQRLRENADDVTVIIGIHPYEDACAAATLLQKQLLAAMAKEQQC